MSCHPAPRSCSPRTPCTATRGSSPDPDRFDPDRWLPDRAKATPRPAFIPFGAGSRQCLGEGFAWVEATVVLATILRRWQFRPVAGPIIRKVALATLVPSRLHLTVQRRAAP